MGEQHAHKKIPVVHILYLECILLHPKEDTTRVSIRWEPLPSELIWTETLQLLHREVLSNRLLDGNDIYVFPSYILAQLIAPSLLPKPPHVPVE